MQLLLAVVVDASARTVWILRCHRVCGMELRLMQACRAQALSEVGFGHVRSLLRHVLGLLHSRTCWTYGRALQLHLNLKNLTLKILICLLQVIS